MSKLTRRAAVVAVLEELLRILNEEQGNGYNAVAARLGIDAIEQSTTRRAAVAQFLTNLGEKFDPQGIDSVLATLRSA